MTEIWKDIKDFPDYKVSNLGNVKSLKRKKERILKQGINNRGYAYVNLCNNGDVKNIKVHRLVAFAFVLNPNPEEFNEINHKDEVKLNNCATNIEWCNRKYNVNYGTRTERFVEHTKGKPKHKSKKRNTENYGKKVECDNMIFSSIKKCAEYYNVNPSTMQSWLLGRRRMPEKFIDLGLKKIDN